jgi:type II secretory pathway pseudopilin PulG
MKTKTRRSGASLLEVVVVMAIIVIVSAVSIPSLRGMYGSYKLNGAVDSVRAGWADARARAIEEGRPYRFAVEPEGSAFRIAPDHPDYWDGTGSVPENDPNGQGLILEKSLPGGVRFTVNGEGNTSMPDEPTNDSVDEKPVSAGMNWSPAIIFLPDGTAREDVKVLFQVRGCKPTSLQLRGLTGNVSVQTEH